MTGSLLGFRAGAMGDLWREYWSALWHRPVGWDNERLACLLDPAEARSIFDKTGQDPMASDFPRGRRPFLGVLTTGPDNRPSPQSGVLELNDDGHLLTIAPTRSGKGAAHIVPNLLLYGGSCLVIDIKGENHAITAAHRARMFEGARVIRFAPFEEDTDTYNPLDFIRVAEFGGPTEHTFDDARILAEMLVPAGPKEEFWEKEARNLLTLILLYVAVRFGRDTGLRNMATVARLLFRGPGDPYVPPAGKEPPDPAPGGLDATLREIRDEGEDMGIPVMLALWAAFQEHEPKVRANVTSTLRSSLMIWLSANLQRATASSSFQFSDLKESMCRPVEADPAPTTIYVIIPPEYLTEYRPVLRVMAGLAAVELTRPAAWAGLEGYRAAPPALSCSSSTSFPPSGRSSPLLAASPIWRATGSRSGPSPRASAS